MPLGLFRIAMHDGSRRWARGDPNTGPEHLLDERTSLDGLLSVGGSLEDALDAGPSGPVPSEARAVAPIESQEVWAAGVTYLRSREARGEESVDRTPYDIVYEAERPELFFKSPGWRARGPGEDIAVRADSAWNTPEPELALVLDATMRVVGYTIGNDVSSRSIEGDNPLYLPQAKIFDGACALGPCIVPASEVAPPFEIRMEVVRDGAVAYEGRTSTDLMKRSFADLAAYLGRALALPTGAVLLTGTALVPDAPFTLEPGDEVRIAIDGLGVLANPVARVGGSPTEL